MASVKGTTAGSFMFAVVYLQISSSQEYFTKQFKIGAMAR